MTSHQHDNDNESTPLPPLPLPQRNESPDSLIQINVNPPSAERERARPDRPDLRPLRIPPTVTLTSSTSTSSDYAAPRVPPIRVQPPSRGSEVTNTSTNANANANTDTDTDISPTSPTPSPRRNGTNDTSGTRYMTPLGGPLKPSQMLNAGNPSPSPSPTVNGQLLSALGGNYNNNNNRHGSRNYAPSPSFLSPTIPTRPLNSPASTRVLDPWTNQFVESVNPYESHFVSWRPRPTRPSHPSHPSHPSRVGSNPPPRSPPLSTSPSISSSSSSYGNSPPPPPHGGFTQDPNRKPGIRLPVTQYHKRQRQPRRGRGRGTFSFVITNTNQLFLLLYSSFLWNLPISYYRRVVRVYEDDNINTALDVFSSSYSYSGVENDYYGYGNGTMQPGWEKLVLSLVKEWKTLNLVSALLLSAIFSMFQLDTISTDSLTRTVALASLVCALMSLLYGCIYIIRFGSMKGPAEARAWFWELTKKRENIVRVWNGWTMLAMPAVWLAWSIILFIISILCFLWRSRMPNPPTSAPFVFELGPQIVISSVLVVGVIYLILILRSFSKFENHHSDLEALTESPSTTSLLNGFSIPDHYPSAMARYPGFPTELLMDDLVKGFRRVVRPKAYDEHDVEDTEWHLFIDQLQEIVRQDPVVTKALTPFINRWNARYFQPRGIQLVLCNETHSHPYPIGTDNPTSNQNPNMTSAHPMSPSKPSPLSAMSFVYESSWKYSLYSTSPPAGSEWRELRPVYQDDEIPIWLAPVQKSPDVTIFPLSGRAKAIGFLR